MDDLREVCCSILTLGQYLQPTANHLPVSEYIHPDRFAEYKRIALEKGFRSVESGPAGAFVVPCRTLVTLNSEGFLAQLR